jgi:hypothetical protein
MVKTEFKMYTQGANRSMTQGAELRRSVTQGASYVDL